MATPIWNLLVAKTTTGNGTTITKPRGSSNLNEGTLIVWGTFDNATVKIQASADGTTWVDIPSASYTAGTAVTLTCYAPYIRADLSNAGAGTSVNAHWF